MRFSSTAQSSCDAKPLARAESRTGRTCQVQVSFHTAFQRSGHTKTLAFGSARAGAAREVDMLFDAALKSSSDAMAFPGSEGEGEVGEQDGCDKDDFHRSS